MTDKHAIDIEGLSTMSPKRQPGRTIFCFLVFAAVYPLVTGLSYLMQATTGDWSIWQRNLVVVPIIVLAMMFVIIPRIQALFARE